MDRQIILNSIKENIEIISNSCINAQDAAIFILLNEGLTINEVINLKIKDIDFENATIRLSNRNNPISIQYLDLIQESYHAIVYLSENGESEEKELLENDYVIRDVRTGENKINNEPINKDVVYQRIMIIGNHLGIDFL